MSAGLLLAAEPPPTDSAPEEPTATVGPIYWPALDGLRAVAVIAVLLYHAGLTSVPGGLLGVDVFFVLSGFLITGLLLDERRRTGTVRLGRFWGRRVRRLLPALLVLLVATVAAAPLLVTADRLQSLRDDALASLFYVGNWRFAYSGQSYFERFTDPSPLLHLWSLGVEEQFYLVWPLLVLLVGGGLVRRRRRAAPEGTGTTRRPGRRVALLAAVLALGSTALLAGLHHAGVSTSRLYYGTDTRALALLVGALTACVLPRAGRPRPRHRRRRAAERALPVAMTLLGVAGGTGLVYAFLTVDGQDARLYDGGFGAVALAAAALVVAVVAAPRAPVARLLGLAPLVGLGRVSYALYLWHWPVFLVLDGKRTGLAGPALLGLRCAVALAFAVASYVLVERPIRRRGRSVVQTDPAPADGSPTDRAPERRRLRLPVAAVAATALTAAVVTVATMPGVLPVTSVGRTTQDLDGLAAGEQADRERLLALPQQPVRPKASEPVRVLVVGDSIGLTAGAALRRVQSQWRVELLNGGIAGCGIGPGSREADSPDRSLPGQDLCSQWPVWWKTTVDRFRPDVVLFLSGRWETSDRYLDGKRVRIGQPDFDQRLAASLDQGIGILSSDGARVGMLTTPCVEPRLRADGSVDPTSSAFRTAVYNGLITDAVAHHPDVAETIDLHAALCPDGQFTNDLQGTSVRDRDGVHIDPDAGPVLAPLIFGATRRMVGLPSEPAAAN